MTAGPGVTAPTLGLLAPAAGPAAWVALAVLVLVLAAVTVVGVVRARRLDRLHRRTDAARAGLADALERRAAVALQVADVLAAPGAPVPEVVTGGSGPGSGRHPRAAEPLAAAAREARAACPPGLATSGVALESCETAENALTRRLAAVDRRALPPPLAGELVDAEQLVVLARRVYNDAVRDTLDLRSRRLVRGLRLAGTAPVPAYFEIADPAPAPGPAPALTRTGP